MDLCYELVSELMSICYDKFTTFWSKQEHCIIQSLAATVSALSVVDVNLKQPASCNDHLNIVDGAVTFAPSEVNLLFWLCKLHNRLITHWLLGKQAYCWANVNKPHSSAFESSLSVWYKHMYVHKSVRHSKPGRLSWSLVSHTVTATVVPIFVLPHSVSFIKKVCTAMLEGTDSC